MAESTTSSRNESREDPEGAPGHRGKRGYGLDVPVGAIPGSGGSTTSSTCAPVSSGAQVSDPGLRYTPRPEATPEAEAEVLAAVFSFVLERHEEKKAARADGAGKEPSMGP